MIRLQWRGQATLQAWRNRCFSSQTPFKSPRPEWPQLRRRQPSPATIAPNVAIPVDESEHQFDRARSFNVDNDTLTPKKTTARQSRGHKPSDGRSKKTGDRRPPPNLRARKPRSREGRATLDWEGVREEPESSAPGSKDHIRNMLVISGVSTNLTPGDFYRLAPSCLSEWESSIKKVEQLRHHKTFEPRGIYLVSFTSSTTAKAYQANLERLMELSQHKLLTTNGLWQSTVQHRLLPPDGTDVSRDVARLTVTSPGQKQISIKRERTSNWTWEQRLSAQLQPLGFGEKPPAVLISVASGGVQASKLQHFIAQDGWQQDLEWKISRPVVLEKTVVGKEEAEAGKAKPKIKGTKFVVACETEWEARRFHRNWNERIISKAVDGEFAYRHLIKTSVVTW